MLEVIQLMFRGYIVYNMAKVEDKLIISSIPFQIIVFNLIFFKESPMLTSYDANAQVHGTVDLWEKHVETPGRLFDIF